MTGADPSTSIVVDLAGTSWEGRAVEDAIVFSWAGEAARLLGTPLFLFQMREKALVEYGRLASQHYLALHRNWIVNTTV